MYFNELIWIILYFCISVVLFHNDVRIIIKKPLFIIWLCYFSYSIKNHLLKLIKKHRESSIFFDSNLFVWKLDCFLKQGMHYGALMVQVNLIRIHSGSGILWYGSWRIIVNQSLVLGIWLTSTQLNIQWVDSNPDVGVEYYNQENVNVWLFIVYSSSITHLSIPHWETFASYQEQLQCIIWVWLCRFLDSWTIVSPIRQE